MELKEILLLLKEFQDSDLSSLKVQLSGDLFEARRGQEEEAAPSPKQDPSSRKTFTKNLPEVKMEETGEGIVNEEEDLEECTQVNAPLVGTFYARPGEEEDPFVQAGDPVKKGQVLCILEAMKVMNEIKSPCDGKVKKVLLKDGEAVDYGKTMFLLKEV